MKYVIVAVLVLVNFGLDLFAQSQENLVVDGQFELIRTEYEDGPGNFYLLKHWRTDYTSDLICPESVDIIWTCSGSADRGCYTSSAHRRTRGAWFDENIIGELKNSLVEGRTYCLNFDLSYSFFGNIYFDSIDVVFIENDFTKNPVQDIPNFITGLSAKDIVSIYTPFDTLNWFKAQTNYVAKGGERFIYMGIMFHIPKNITLLTPDAQQTISFICIDNVVLYDCTEGVEFALPNVFTPNGDGENEVYRSDQFNVERVEWVVLNRWGQVVHTGKAAVLEWDGRDVHSGEDLAEGVYFVRATAYGNDGSIRTEQQTVHLMR